MARSLTITPSDTRNIVRDAKREAYDQAATYLEDLRPPLHGVEYGLASLEDRRAMREDHDRLTELAKGIRSLGNKHL